MAFATEHDVRERSGFPSLEEMRREILRVAEQTPEGETAQLTIELEHDSYSLTSPIRLSAKEHPALSRLRLHLKAKSGTRPTLTGLLPLCGTAFERQAGKPYFTYRFEKNEAGQYPLFRELYVGGARLLPARSVSFLHPHALTVGERRGEVKRKGLYLPLAAVREMLASEGAVYFTLQVEWECFTMRVKGADLSDTREENGETYALVTFRDEFDFFVRAINGCLNIANREGYFWGGTAYLTPGSFVYDHEKGLLHYYPREGERVDELTLQYPAAGALLYLEGLEGVTLEGLRFTGTTSDYVFENGYFSGQANTEKRVGRLPHAAVCGDEIRGLTVLNCDFSALGGNGLLLRDGAVNITVRDSVFRDIGMSAISVGNPSAQWEEKRNRNFNICVENNLLSHIAYTYPTSAAAYFGMVDGLRFLRNTVRDTAYSAFSAGWFSIEDFTLGERVNLRDVCIAYNFFEDFMMVLRDGAAVYVAGNNCEAGDARRFNRMHDNFARRHGVNTASRGFYLDASSSNWEVFRNVAIGCHYPFFAQFHVPSQYTFHCHLYENYADRKVDAGNHAPWRDTLLLSVYDNVAEEAAMLRIYPDARAICDGAGCKLCFH